jgi:hypothetical protein
MKEFMQFVGYAKGSKYIFDDFLVQKANYLIKNRTLFQRFNFMNKSFDE